MKKLTALGVGLTLVHAAWASTYVRPQVAYLMPEESGAKSTVGAFVALGYSPAAHGEHELEIELGWADWDYEESATIDDFSFVGKAGYKILPVMLNYRFNTKLVEKTAAYFQLGGGIANVSTDWDVTVEDGEDTVSVIGDDSDSVAAFSVGAGLTWTVAEQTTFNVGYRYLKLATVDVEITDLDTLSIDNAGAHVIDAGFNIRF